MENDFDQQLPDHSAEQHKDWLQNLPVLVSIPRAGSNWLQAVMELYFDRHRGGKGPNNPSWLQSKFENPMWMGSHDNFGNQEEGDFETEHPVIFLWRDPSDVIYSFLKLQNCNRNIPWVIHAKMISFTKIYKKWALGRKNVLVVKYEDIVSHPLRELERISEWFNVEFDEARASWAFTVAGNIMKTNLKNGSAPHFKNKESGTTIYETGRDQFRSEWGKEINQLFTELLRKI